jgi:hypothetical protein
MLVKKEEDKKLALSGTEGTRFVWFSDAETEIDVFAPEFLLFFVLVLLLLLRLLLML